MKHVAEFLDYAVYLGVEEPRIERRRRHPVLVGTYAGRPVNCVIAGTPSDHRSMLNARSYLRRILGLTNAGKKLRHVENVIR